MTKSRNGIITALDIGSAKMTCFIARASAESGIRVIGIGHHAAYGVRGGAIVDMDAANSSILTAVNAAEEMAGEQIRSAVQPAEPWTKKTPRRFHRAGRARSGARRL